MELDSAAFDFVVVFAVFVVAAALVGAAATFLAVPFFAFAPDVAAFVALVALVPCLGDAAVRALAAFAAEVFVAVVFEGLVVLIFFFGEAVVGLDLGVVFVGLVEVLVAFAVALVTLTAFVVLTALVVVLEALTAFTVLAGVTGFVVLVLPADFAEFFAGFAGATFFVAVTSTSSQEVADLTLLSFGSSRDGPSLIAGERATIPCLSRCGNPVGIASLGGVTIQVERLQPG